MYYFEDTKKKLHKDELILPSSAMMYDGAYIENIIAGYRTLTVTGREMLSVNIETEESQIGSIKTNQTLPARVIKVTYQLIGKDAEELQKKYHKLMQVLYTEEEVEIRFKDAFDYHYYGQYMSTDEVRGDTNSIISSFELLCKDPRKYSRLFKSDGDIVSYLPYLVTPEKIEVEIRNVGGLMVTNGTEQISCTSRNFQQGDKVVFDFKMGKVFLNNVDQTFLLDLASDFENFYLRQGQTISSNNGNITISYREVLL